MNQISKILPIALSVLASPAIGAAEDGATVHEHVLGNGLKLLVKEDHRSPVVVSQVWYKVGSTYEPGGITGISHMLEHMMFKGTKNYPAGEFSRIVAENGGQENAFTGTDYTAYFQTLEKSRLEISFKLEADRMRYLDLKAEELEKEREVVTEERRMRTDDRPRAKMQEHFNAVAFTNSPYQNPIIGWPSDIAHYTIADLNDWYQRWYAPNNATLVVVGDIDTRQVVELAEKYFAPLTPSQITPVKPQSEVDQLGTRKLTVKAPAKLPYVLMGYKAPALTTPGAEADVYALEVLAGILDGGNGARLTSRLIRGQEIAVSAGASYDMGSRLPYLFMLEATPSQGKSVFDLEYALKHEVQTLQSELVDDNELNRVKAQVVAHDVYQKDSNFFQAMELGLLETIGVGWKKSEDYVARIRQVTAEQVRDVARKYLIDDHLTVAYLDPQPIPTTATPRKSSGGRHAF
ncbi:MAG: peptidase M16 [Methylomonas sp.]|nr:MAG: peptidase M16 [Methylomonas sp.]PPD24675.1 MAG: peptidase M16 [Methylomonas sp.]PPD33224.1 MAG: peptidase M16 [Methylomonas sp.]PPD41684.1 MAG: peptidase M16 [Methylomonas sp.]PPD54536.1 MAG: peptidase M16 [Methylomonas sp.]